MLKVSEIFRSCEGEGVNAGLPTTFVRLYGCNLRCVWCDTDYAVKNKGKYDSVDIEFVGSSLWKEPFIAFTGGEPLLQGTDLGKLVRYLRHGDIFRCIEVNTNGCYVLPDWRDKVDTWVVDVKCPSSGEESPLWAVWDELGCNRSGISLKFVVGNSGDLEFVKSLSLRRARHEYLVSPVWGDLFWTKKVWDFCAQEGFRFSLQLHKVLFGNERGV